MGSSIHPKTVQEVKEKADIVDVISEHVVLKKRGRNMLVFVLSMMIVNRQ